ncbi:UDP-glucose/GDP-mannose dehydrogenase family protein [Rothia sp. SD9660Na]|uniref:UDP-glucose dehydrogenase family protein n=1 Tax=Rothia sp. SD9660Na TaxID=3047030 RepID=UPI0024B8E22F|nr:UDP-glucose/GDP-mannose dehydrogenase family protein [Rothia sp. SD9660Na]WHS49753.1 UDP-glucose/GDP-mannose dehydrogenase family protein [Rothia sp. SD9660Na]
MKISVIGCGYLGAVHAAAMAHLGHQTIGIDVDPHKIDTLSAGKAPFFEPGFPQLLRSSLDAGKLSFQLAPASDTLADVDVHFIAVGTPQSESGKAANLTYVESALDMVLEAIPAEKKAAATPERPATIIVGKSTVPVGTASRLAERAEQAGAVLLWNPEFLREGFAVQDTLHPDRLVYGLPAEPRVAQAGAKALDAVYAPLLAEGIPQIKTNYPTAELVKVAANSFLATKISFINAMAELCEATGGDVTELAHAIGYDERIGNKFLRAGVGFGGGCLPKDIRAFMARAEELGVEDAVSFLRDIDAINQRRRDRVVTESIKAFGGEIEGARITVLGAAFKPNSDDIRDSPALEVALRLADAGATVTISDPEALPGVAARYPQLTCVQDPEQALVGAQLVLLLTEWQTFVELDPARVASLVERPRIIDGRNALDKDAWQSAGWDYAGLGR